MWHFSPFSWYVGHERKKLNVEVHNLAREFFNLESLLYKFGECGMYGFHPHSYQGRIDYERMHAIKMRVAELCLSTGGAVPNPIEEEYKRRRQVFDSGIRDTGPLEYRYYKIEHSQL
jgi:hypothetical protein